MEPSFIPATGPDLSPLGLLAHADIVVQGVIVGLVLCSIGSWAIILEKLGRLRGLRRSVRRLEADATKPLPATVRGVDLASRVLAAAGLELAAIPAASVDREGVRGRLAEAMRATYLGELRGLESGLSFLATIGSAAPFIGLFGTVWGIMRSFTSIAAAKDTSLGVVAPGIAEALIATAAGLAAAIPAVVAYNLILASLAQSGQRLGSAVATRARTAATAAAGDGALQAPG